MKIPMEMSPGRHSPKGRTVKIETEKLKKVLRQKGCHVDCVETTDLVRNQIY